MELLFGGRHGGGRGAGSPAPELAALQFVHVEGAVLLVAKETEEGPLGAGGELPSPARPSQPPAPTPSQGWACPSHTARVPGGQAQGKQHPSDPPPGCKEVSPPQADNTAPMRSQPLATSESLQAT